MITENGINITCADELRKLAAYSSLSGNSLIAWKNCDSQFLFANEFFAKITGYHSTEHFLKHAIFDHDLACPASELAIDFQEEDKEVVEFGNTMNFLTYAYYSDWIVLLGKKVPIFDINKEKVIAIALNYLDISNTKFALSGFKLYTNLKKKNVTKKNQATFRLDANSPLQESLTERERECLFYLIYGNTAKEIAYKMNISFRTVEFHLDNLKHKLQCDKKSALIEKAIHMGYANFLPVNIM